MPPVIKFITQFRGGEGYGWSEVHWKLASGENPNLRTQIDTYMANVAPLRAEMLGEDCAMVGVVASYPRPEGIASYGRRDYLTGHVGETGSAPALSIAVQFHDSTNTKHKITHLRGFWDDVEFNESYHPENAAAAGWVERLTQWKVSLTDGGYGWLTKDLINSARGPVNTYTENPNGTVTFTLAAPGMPAPTVGTLQQVRFSKINASKSTLNRQLIVSVDTALSLTTTDPIATGPFISKGRFNYRALTFTAYNDTGSISLGERRMGKPLNRRPGRAKGKART
jgi:hypothetical protein